MNAGNKLSALVDHAYAAAIDDSLWETWATACLREFGGYGGIFAVVDERGPTPDRTVNLWPDHRVVDDYLAELVQLDPQLPVVSGLSRSTIYVDTDHVDLENPNTREFTKWIESLGGRHHLTGVFLLGDGPERACISMHYSAQDGPTPMIQRERLASIFPALGHAFKLGFHHAELLQDAFWEGLTVLDDRRAAVLVDERGRVLRASGSALRLIDANEGLRLTQQVLGCERPGDDERIAAMIAAAVRPVEPTASALRLDRKSGRFPLLVTAYPLTRSRRMLAPLEAAALVTIIDPTELPPPKSSLWRSLFDLTAREAELAELLLVGHSVESAAATLQMAMPTARTHLRSIFQKTGTDRQSNLLRLLSRVV